MIRNIFCSTLIFCCMYVDQCLDQLSSESLPSAADWSRYKLNFLELCSCLFLCPGVHGMCFFSFFWCVPFLWTCWFPGQDLPVRFIYDFYNCFSLVDLKYSFLVQQPCGFVELVYSFTGLLLLLWEHWISEEQKERRRKMNTVLLYKYFVELVNIDWLVITHINV